MTSTSNDQSSSSNPGAGPAGTSGGSASGAGRGPVGPPLPIENLTGALGANIVPTQEYLLQVCVSFCLLYPWVHFFCLVWFIVTKLMMTVYSQSIYSVSI